LIRKVVAIILWSLVILAFILSFRSSTVTSLLLEKFKESMPPDQVKERVIAAEFGREYIKEWLTWYPDEANEKRIKRLRAFNSQFNDTGVVKTEKPSIPSSVTVLECVKIETGYKVKTLVIGTAPTACYETKIGFTADNKPFAASKPLLVAAPKIVTDIGDELHSSVPEQVKVFAERFLEAYLEGESESDTDIFTVPDSKIRPAGMAKLVKLDNIKGNDKRTPNMVRAYYHMLIGDHIIKQEILLHLVWQNGKPLIKKIEC